MDESRDNGFHLNSALEELTRIWVPDLEMSAAESSFLLKAAVFGYINALDAIFLHVCLGTLLRLIDDHMGVPIISSNRYLSLFKIYNCELVKRAHHQNGSTSQIKSQ